MIKITTDSTCDLPAQLLEQHHISVIPLGIVKGGELFRDGENITAPLSERPLPLELLTDYAAAGARIFSGGTSTKLEALCETHGLQLVNYMAAEELTLKNALLTAEGAVSLLISGYDGALFDSTAVITGYGRIARYLARLLQAFRCRVTIAARSPLQRVY